MKNAIKSPQGKRGNMKSTHTKGPWIVYQDSFAVAVQTENRDPLIKYGNICQFGDCNGLLYQSVDETMANARLIAAAPDMLAALQGLFEHCAMVHNRWGDGDNTKEANKAIETARLVIAKATGEDA